jgi:predicted permease
MFLKLFILILSIFLMVLFGALARKRNILDGESTRRIAIAITNFFYPALIFSALTSHFTLRTLTETWQLPVGALIVMATGYFVGIAFSPFLSFRHETERNSFAFQCTINNYSFLPLPIILLLFGESGVAMLIFSTLGSELAVWTIGVLALTGNRFTRKNLLHLLSVPMLALIFALVVIVIRELPMVTNALWLRSKMLLEANRSFISVLDLFGKATVPLAMFAAGSRMSELKWSRIFSFNQLVLASIRLLLIPAIACVIFFLLPLKTDVRNVLLVLAIMPSAVASVILSEVYGADVVFSATGVLVSHIFSLVTIPAWLYFLLR